MHPESSQRAIREQGCSGDTGDTKPTLKRNQRRRYASKACGQCQRRKIRQCDGNTPCRACIAKARDCQRHGTDMRGRWRSKDKVLTGPAHILAPRLNRVERGLKLRSPVPRTAQVPRDSNESLFARGNLSLQVPTFSGETSIAHNLTVVEGRLEQMGVHYGHRPASPDHSFRSCLTPSPEPPTNHSPDRHADFIPRVLQAHGIIPDRKKWEGLMHTFCDEVHILVPFLHPPSLWNLHEEIWESSFGDQSGDYDRSMTRRMQAAHVLLCVANGRCVETSRAEGGSGPYSAGWSLYSAARGIFGDLLEGFRQCKNHVFVLQTVLLIVIYLFRLDAHGSAEKVLALSISHAHHLGLQRERVVKKMPTFQGEMSRRLWWCIYLLDRRLAIETGRPFLIQDVNIDVGLPHNVSDEWLTRCQIVKDSSIAEGTVESGPTKIPYLVAMASYSRVIGKVWEALYGAATSESTSSPLLNEYLEHLITQSQTGIRPEFSYNPHRPSNHGLDGMSWWQIKQHLMMRIRWSSLYLLIRKPMLQMPRSHQRPAPETIENEVVCMRLARSIIDDFGNVPEEHPKYTFPFLHYLSSATIIALGLIIKQPSFKSTYATLTLEAARSLREHCAKTWVSGKMAQTVWKLNQMAVAALSSDEPSPAAIEGSTGNHSATHVTHGPRPALKAAQHQHNVVFEDPPIDAQRLISDMTFTGEAGFEQDLSIQDEMVDGGIEWLQTLFADGLDTQPLSVWD
ncbi:hypothetical protein N7448_009028 [Penicillium atrosanguineum]|uniref:C6 zinc finger domain protein n=1 Tax=Penicillium atrosanguineum TaxID=1132637 RepID=UPI00238F5D6D|nr:C6 zinc finger domain protein [Penicillium atrosanguineum]KAJ5122931.1 hypothetical protein N7448_009028 [Penicillium atrosanguineum]KAJ5298154.1 C6 zinc finger domain protein [Penicillium atrosanguineum]